MTLPKTTTPSGANHKNFYCGGNFPQVVECIEAAEAADGPDPAIVRNAERGPAKGAHRQRKL